MAEMIFACGPDGSVTVTVEGMKGLGCRALTRPYEEALGGAVLETEDTLEARQAERAPARVTAGGR